MLEIIALVFLTRKIGELAARKGLKSGWWKFYFILKAVLSKKPDIETIAFEFEGQNQQQ